MKLDKHQMLQNNRIKLTAMAESNAGFIYTLMTNPNWLEFIGDRNIYGISDANEYIKKVCDFAKLHNLIKGGLQIDNRKVNGLYPKWQLVTSHIGRRSFATNNYGKIPTALLIGVTGHSTESMFLEYIGKTDTQKAMALAEFF